METIVTKTLPQRIRAHVQDPRRLHALEVRDTVEAAVHAYFRAQKFRHVRTPLLVASPGMEAHIRPFETKTGAYLPTSPEFAMKQLLAGGLPSIYQVCPAFRDEPASTTHAPEFTMLEWYRAGAPLSAIMEDVERLFGSIAQTMFESSCISFQGQAIDLKPPWPRLRVADLFRDYADIDLEHAIHHPDGFASGSDTWEDTFFRIWLNQIEPNLPKDRPVFVTDYPPSLAALSRVEDGWAKRFEVYAGGLELGNAFWELTDAEIQRERYETFMRARESAYGASFPRTPLDPEFMRALEEGLPESSGIAIGLDRVIMLFADESDIRYTVWLESKGAQRLG